MLPDKNGEFRVSIAELAVLISNFLIAVKAKNEIGFEDAEKELHEFFDEELVRIGRVPIKVRTMEGLLWACNLRSETLKGPNGFWEPRGRSLSKFVNKMLWRSHIDGRPLEFDPEYNVLTFKKPETTETKKED